MSNSIGQVRQSNRHRSAISSHFEAKVICTYNIHCLHPYISLERERERDSYTHSGVKHNETSHLFRQLPLTIKCDVRVYVRFYDRLTVDRLIVLFFISLQLLLWRYAGHIA